MFVGCNEVLGSSTLREEHRFRDFEHRVLRGMLGRKRGEVFIRVIKSRRMRMAGHVARMGKIRNAYNILVGKSEWKRPHSET
jgi:hypothetical protein